MTPLLLFEPPKLDRRSLAPFRTPAGRKLKPTVAFASYWYFAAERQAMFFRRLRGDPILTSDPILRNHRFTNAYRAADRVSQFFISQIALDVTSKPEDIIFRTLLFKFFNRVETWVSLERELGEPISLESFVERRYDAALGKLVADGQAIYSSAYMMPNPSFGHRFKHSNHLALLQYALNGGLAWRLLQAKSLESVYQELRLLPSLGPFLAFQFTIDLNYTGLFDFAESEFVVAGPGALDGIRKCFDDVADYQPIDVIKIVADHADTAFEKNGIPFVSLWGRPLQLIDCQNLFCEVDKYARVAHPSLNGVSGRHRIKQRFSMSSQRLPIYAFPKRWNLSPTTSFGNVSRLEYSML